MNLDRPSATGGQRPKAEPLKSGAASDLDALKNLRSQNAQHEAVEIRKSTLGNLVMDHWDGGINPAKCFGVEVSPSLIPDEVVDCLTTIETDYELDLVQSIRLAELEPSDVGDMLAAELETRAVETQAEDAKVSLNAYRSKVETLRGEGKVNTEIILALANDPTVPKTERLRLQAFASIMRISVGVPADQAIIKARINQIDAVAGFPDPATFARTFVFDTSESVLKTGVSETTQDAIAAELGIVRHKYAAKTGGDVNDIYKKSVGMERYLDENGDVQERPVYLQAGDDVEIRDGQYIGLSDTNEPVMKIIGEHTYTSDLPENATDHDMTMYGITTQWIAKLNDVNMAEMFFPHSVMERGGGHIKLNMPDDFNRAQELSQIFFGAMAGYNGELLDQSDLNRIPYLMQFQNEKGDAVIGDVNPEQMRTDYRRQGVLNKDNTLNWERFGQMIAANRNGLFFREEQFGRMAA